MQTTLRTDVEQLARRAGRMVGTAGHDAARDFLEARLATVGVTPLATPRGPTLRGSRSRGAEATSGTSGLRLTYTSGRQRFENLVGEIAGVEPALEPMVLGAHYDTCGALPGADDNAAAVAIALEIGRRLVARPARRTVWLCLFDAEEPPYFQTRLMGSTRFFHTQQPRMPHCAIVMDLVGHDVPLEGAEAAVFTTGAESHPDLVDVVRRLAAETTLDLVSTLNAYIGDMSDYHAFRLGGCPYLFFSCGRWEHYHAPTDTPERLNYDKMASIADLVESGLRAVADQPLAGRATPADTVEVELATLRPLVARHPLLRGMPLEDRASIDRLVRLLVGQMGL